MSPFDLRPTLSSALAELSMAALAEAAFGDVDLAATPIASAVAHALDAPVLVLALDDLGGGERALVPTACVRVTPQAESFPVAPLYASALLHDEPTVAESLPPLSADGGVLARIGSRHDPLALLVALTPEGRVFDAEERIFLHAAASVLHARLALDRQRHELAESQDQARAVVETSVDGIITIDERGRIQTFNPGASRIFGYTAEEVRGRNVHVLMPEPYHTEHDGYVQAYLDTGERRIIGIGREVTGRRKSGETFPMDLAVSEVCLQDGNRLFVGLVRDISERRDP
ncbi:MAG TPA: PAS domain S-box protein, partial [Bacteroidetes bacterium]|nr:PAS domain S-box protein [Bacteroidota bacterium]